MRFVPHWRIFTWVILAVNLIALIYVVASANMANPQGAAEEAGAAIGVGILIVLWVLADIVLGLLWLVTKPHGRDCPVCGNFVKRGKMTCRKCGHDFAAAAGGHAPQPH